MTDLTQPTYDQWLRVVIVMSFHAVGRALLTHVRLDEGASFQRTRDQLMGTGRLRIRLTPQSRQHRHLGRMTRTPPATTGIPTLTVPSNPFSVVRALPFFGPHQKGTISSSA